MPNWSIDWHGAQALKSRRYECGYCGSPIASERGWYGIHPMSRDQSAWIYICHQCLSPTFIDPNGDQTPGSRFGSPVEDVSDESVLKLYEEARGATAAGSFTAAVLCCRKLLMHVAVAKGAKPGESFLSYVEYLAEKNYVPPDARGWVDHIRAKGNEANHQIAIMSRDEAEELISFSEMLLKIIYQFPATVRRRVDGS